jgi:hypothetical protein
LIPSQNRNLKQQKLTRSQFGLNMPAEVERLIAVGRMPTLDKVLAQLNKRARNTVAVFWTQESDCAGRLCD